MPFLGVDPGELLDTADRIEGALAVGDEVRSSHGALADTAMATGRSDAEGAVTSFLRAWAYGLSCVNGDARTLARILLVAGNAYEEAEKRIVGAEGK